jgi:ABC-type multidrug transport system ATPase subunit
MQLKFNDRKINVLDGKITGITSNSVDDINYFFDNNLSKKIYKISLNNIDYSCNMSVKDYLLNYYKIDELLKLLNLSSKIINREVNTLSFSEKVRIEIAFAIIKDYDNIYINNVLSCFDRKTRMYFCKLIIKLKKLYNKTIIISDINIDNIFELIDNLIIINDKDVIYNGEKYEFYASNKNNLFEKPLTIILKEEIYEKKGINIGNTDSINELIKAIYRELR